LGIGDWRFFISFFFGKNAAAVFLYIQAASAGYGLALPEKRPEIPVQKGNAPLRGRFLSNTADRFMLLPRADKEARGKSVKAVFRGIGGGLFQPHAIAYMAASRRSCLGANALQKKIQPIFVCHYQRQFLAGGKLCQGVAAVSVFGQGVYVGIVPEQRRRFALGDEAFNACD
jgi:hypothetical protein